MSETKYCINCGKAIPTNATFCPFCGATQDKVASTEDQNTITSEQHNTPNQPEHVNMWTALKLGMRQTFTWSPTDYAASILVALLRFGPNFPSFNHRTWYQSIQLSSFYPQPITR